MNYAWSKTATMVKPRPITMPAKPIGRVPSPVDLIELAKKTDNEDPKLAPLLGAAVRDLIEHIEGASSPVVTDDVNRESITISARTACMDFRTQAPGDSMIRLPTVRRDLGGTVNL
jgi:hypothetical protein